VCHVIYTAKPVLRGHLCTAKPVLRGHLCTVKLVLRGHFWDKEIMALYDRWPLKRGSIHMKLSMTGQWKDDLLIQVTAWAGMTVVEY
jgi:hypothetical protein